MKAIVRTWCALSGFILLSANPLLADHWESRAPGPGARVAHSVVFTGHEVIVWGGGRANTWLKDGARYDAATDTWTPISTNHTLAGRWWHAAVWTGKEMIVWGGRGTFSPQQHYGDGARYNPATGTWTPMSSQGAPSPRSQLSAVWTGAEMIVWGGTGDDFNEKGDGARYNPETDTWTPLAAAPLDARLQPTAVWSGSEMIIFGGLRIDNPVNQDRSFGDGAAYNPANNTWRVLSTNDAPRSRSAHTAVWTGKEMMVWGGRSMPGETFLNSGGSYDPVQDRWTPISENSAPPVRSDHAAVWSGTELIVWGGYVGSSTELATGGRYNPVSRTWTATTMEGAPQARFFGGGIASVWTGNAMFIYGGWDYPAELNTTALYFPPVVTWLSPRNGATFLPGATISLMASVVTDAAVSFVEFFAGSTNQMMNLGRGLLTSNNVYLLLWSNAPAGTFQMHAEAEDNLGRRSVSGSVQITVATPTNFTWTGADPSGYWSAPANWFPTGVPTNGAELVFPGGLPPGGLPPEDMVSTNDLTGSIFRSIRFDETGGHTIRGNPITLTNRSDCIINSGTNVIACDLTFSGTPSTPQSPTIRDSGYPGGELTVIGNVGGGSLYVFAMRLVIRGQFTGGSLRVAHNTMALYGDNPYAVSADVWGSTLLVQGSQPNLNITLRPEMETFTHSGLRGNGQVGDVTGFGTINLDSTLSVKNVTVYLGFYLNGTNVGEYGRLVASGDVSTTTGFFRPSAGFSPQAGQVYTIVEKTSPGLVANAFLGPEGTLTTLNGMLFRISYVGGDGNDVTLTAMGPPPTVTVVGSDATAFESGDIGVYTITRTGSTASSLVINYTLSGTAQNGTDYNSLPGSVTILAGANSATVSVVPMADTAVEGNETVVLTLAPNNAYTIGSPNSATVTIVDIPKNFVNFETAPVHPIALGPDGQTLVVCNLPDNRLEIFDVSGGVPIPTGSVPVGLDPVTVRFASSNELWVVNHISSSVSIIDLASLNVIDTLETPAGPSDVVFAGNPRRAWISCSRTNSILVVDPATRAAVANIAIDGERPRAMATSPDGTKVYVAIFESGNGSTILGRRLTELFVEPPPGPLDDSNSPYAGADPPPNSGTAFSPPINPALTGLPPRVSHIVRKNASGRWMDDNNADWTEWVSGTKASLSGRIQGWDLPDRDLAVIDTATLQVTYARRLMNICMAVAVNPASGQIAVVGTDGTNQRRFEPNLKGVFLRVNLGLVDPVTLTHRIRDLNPHLDYITRSLPPAQRALALGDPRGIEWNAAGTRAYVTGMGSRNLVVIDADGARVNSQPIDLGEGPTGMALDEARSRVYVWNRFSSTISVVDTEAGTVMTNISVFDPTPDIVRKGRRHLYDTRANSGLGNVACGSCHVDARLDRLAWDLGDPAGERVTNGFNTFHPMKGPLLTQTLQDIITPTDFNRRQLPLHWRADRTNIEAFNVTFPALLARDTQLSSNEMAEFKGMLQSISFPPNYLRTFSNTLPTSVALPGLFGRTNTGVRQPLPAGNPQAALNLFSGNCRFCHTFNQGTGSGPSNQVFTLTRAGTEGAFKTSQLRNLLDRLGMDALSTNSRAGFGFMHDGRVDSLTHFLNAGFPETVPNDINVANLVAFMLCFSGSDFGQAPISPSQDVPSSAGKQVTFAPSAPPQLVTEMFNLASRTTSRLEFIVRGKKNGLVRNWWLRRATADFQSDRHGEIAATLNDILAGATSEFTAMLVPQNTGWRLALDRDQDGYLNASELEAGTDPGDPSSYPGRILRIAKAGSDILLSWQSAPGARYTIQWRTNWPPATWLDAVPRVTSSLPITVWTDSPPVSDRHRYYRVRMDP